MPIFLESLNRSGHLDDISLTLCIAGSRKLKEYNEDYASQGWNIFGPRLTIYGFDADKTACEAMNAAIAEQSVNWTEKHIPLALWNSSGKFTLHITKYPGCSSLYPPDPAYRERFVSNAKILEVVSTVEVETTTLDVFFQAEGVEEIDFLQVDVQGGDLKVLEGASHLLKHSVLSIVTEVEFMKLYENQPLFGDVDVYLREQGFTLFDITNINRDMRRHSILVPKEHPGPLLWADAFYFRDLIQKNCKSDLKNPARILKLACIADVLNFNDYTLELLEYLTLNYGEDKRYNFADNIIETLAQFPEILEYGLESLDVVARIRDYARSYNFRSSGLSTQQSPEVSRNQSNFNPAEPSLDFLWVKLRDVNFIIFLDWTQPEEPLGLELERVIKTLATHPDRHQMTLLIDTSSTSEEDAHLLVSGVVMHLLMQDDLDVTQELELSLLGNLEEVQWEVLLPRLKARIVWENNNDPAIAQISSANLPTCGLDSLSQMRFLP